MGTYCARVDSCRLGICGCPTFWVRFGQRRVKLPGVVRTFGSPISSGQVGENRTNLSRFKLARFSAISPERNGVTRGAARFESLTRLLPIRPDTFDHTRVSNVETFRRNVLFKRSIRTTMNRRVHAIQLMLLPAATRVLMFRSQACLTRWNWNASCVTLRSRGVL